MSKDLDVTINVIGDPESEIAEAHKAVKKLIAEVQPIRTGDTVLHKPSDERWLVAYVQGDRLAWCGWPEGEAKLSDCELIKACSDEQHWKLVREIANNSSGARQRWAAWYLQQNEQVTGD